MTLLREEYDINEIIRFMQDHKEIFKRKNDFIIQFNENNTKWRLWEVTRRQDEF